MITPPELKNFHISRVSVFILTVFFVFLGCLGFHVGYQSFDIEHERVYRYALLLEEENAKIYKKLRDFKNKTD